MAEQGGGNSVLVIGAGVVGISCAMFLQRAGFAVSVIDRVGSGESCSFGNASGVAITEMLPISRPGMAMKVPGWLLDPDGPLSVPVSYMPRLAPWMLRFLRAGSAQRVRELAVAAAALARCSIDDHEILLSAANAKHLLFGDFCASIYDRESEYERAKADWDLRAELGFPCHKISGAEMHELEPDISPDIGCAVIMDGWRNYSDPYRFVTALAECFVRNGGTIVCDEVVGFDVENSQVNAVRLAAGGAHRSDHVVVAAGAWSHLLAEQLGSSVPLEADRGYNTTMPNTGIKLGRQLVYEAGGLAVTPLSEGLRIGGAVEFAGLDAPPNYRRADAMLRKASKILPGLKDTSGTQWMGHRPALPDFVPVIGRSPVISNVFYTFGHGHLGLTWGPTSGRLVAEMVAGQPPSLDLEPYRVDRF